MRARHEPHASLLPHDLLEQVNILYGRTRVRRVRMHKRNIYCTFQTVSSGRLIVTRDVPLGSPVIGSRGCVMRDGEPIGWAIMFELRRRERALALRHVLRTWDAPVSLGDLLWRSYSVDTAVTRTS